MLVRLQEGNGQRDGGSTFIGGRGRLIRAGWKRIMSMVISISSPIERLVMPGFAGFAGSFGNCAQVPFDPYVLNRVVQS